MTIPARLNTFKIKQGNTVPRIETVLLDGDGVPVDLTDAISVTLSMSMCDHPRTAVFTDRAASFTADTSGAVWYAWVAGDTATVGDYNIEWTVTYAAGSKMTVPSDGYDRVIVGKRL